MNKLVLSSFAAVALLAVNVLPTRASTTVPLPNSMASTGDSITRAYDINWLHLLQDSPQYSWSTGYNTSVNSQYRHILAMNTGITNHEYNDAKTGAKMADLYGQVQTAASQKVDYLTILMGANDLCTSSIATMTPTDTFRAQFQQALSYFVANDPTAHVYVSSLPNLYYLWSLLHTNSSAASAWKTFGICQSMLSTSNSDANRQQVDAQEQADNQALADVCAQYPNNCRWDSLAGYHYQFTTGDISTVDYFHPSIQGQNNVAGVTWKASYWGS